MSPAVESRVVDLTVQGMTCASCVSRVEKKLSRLQGVQACVNLATESARVTAPPSVSDDELLAAVARAGYAASLRPSAPRGGASGPGEAAPAPPGRSGAAPQEALEAPTAGAAGESAADGGAQAPPSPYPAIPTGPTASAEPAESAESAESAEPAEPAGRSNGPRAPAEPTAGSASAALPPPPLGSSHLVRAADLRLRLVYSLILSVPVMAVSMIPALQLPGWQWTVAVMAVPVATWGAWPFHRAAWAALRHAAFTMDTLVSLGVIAATGWSLWALVWGGAGQIGMTMPMEFLPRHQGHAPHLYFESAAWVTTFLLAGRYAEARAKYRSGDALRALLELGAKEAVRVSLFSPSGSQDAVDVLTEDGTPAPLARRREESVPVDDLRIGDLIAVRPGEKIATDGVVIEGRSGVDAAMLTGESLPVDVGPGDTVTGGCLNTSGALLVRVTRVGAGTTLARIGAMVTAAQAGKAPVQRLADRVSGVFVPVVICLAVATLTGWILLGRPVQQALTAAVAVLVIACPCALGLATPTALLVGSGRAAQLGVVIKGPQILESTRTLDTIVLDKTGTVTEGRMSLDVGGDLVLIDAGRRLPAGPAGTDGAVDTALALAGAVEAAGEHPVAVAVAGAARRRLGSLPTVSDFSNHEGRGVTGRVVLDGADNRVAVGRPDWITGLGATIPADAAQAIAAAQASGATAVVLAVDPAAGAKGRSGPAEPTQPGPPTVLAVLAVRDTIRPGSRKAIAALRAEGVRPILLTGDNTRAAAHVADVVGIAPQDVRAEVLPADKRDVVAALQAEGRVVGMVGDGVNDAAALAQAGVQGLGFAMGSGTDAAIEAADITLVRTDLHAAVTAIRVSRATLRVIKQNLFWAFFYNVLSIPVAVLGLLNPMIAGAAMAASSVIVVSNSLRLRRAR